MGALVSFASTNSVGQPDTNAFKAIPVSGPVAYADGSFTTIGIPIRIQPGADGRATNFLAQNNYLITNAFLGQGYYIRVPLDSGGTVYPSGQLLISGGNMFVTVTNGPGGTNLPTFNQLTNIFFGTPIVQSNLPALTNGFITLLEATNVANAKANSSSNSIYNYFTTQLAIQSALSLSNAFATNAAGVTYASGRIYISTNYDALGTALAIGAAGTNYTLAASNVLYALHSLGLTNAFATNAAGVSFANGRAYISTNYDALGIALTVGGQLTNYVNTISNELQAQIVSGSVNASTATNIAIYTVGLATNGYSPLVFTNVGQVVYTNMLVALTNGFVDRSITNGYATTNYATGVTNGLGISSGLAAFARTNQFVGTQFGGATNLNVGGGSMSFDRGILTVRMDSDMAAVDGMPVSIHSSTNEVTVSGVHLQTYNTNAIGGAAGADVGIWSPGFGPDYSGRFVIDLYNTNLANSTASAFVPPGLVINESDARDGGVVNHPIVFINPTNLNFVLPYRTNLSREIIPGFVWEPTIGVMPFRNASKAITGLGTVSGSGTTITGVGTQFGDGRLAQAGMGDQIVVGVVAYTIKSVSSATSITVAGPGISPTFSGQPYTIYKNPVTWYSLDGVTPFSAIGPDGVPVIKEAGDGAFLRLLGNIKDYRLGEGGSGELYFYNTSDNTVGFSLTPTGDLTLGGIINANGAGLTNTSSTNLTGTALIQSTNIANARIAVASNALQSAISVKADTNTPTIFTPLIKGGSLDTVTNNNTYFTGGLTPGSYIGGNSLGIILAPYGGGGLVTVQGTLSATNISVFSGGRFIGNGSGITNASSTNLTGTALMQVTNIAASVAVASVGITNALGTNFPNGATINQTLFYPTNDPALKVSATNGFATGLLATNTALEGSVSFGATGQATNIVSSTSVLKFLSAGSGQATNGTFVWSGALNCYTNWYNGAIATNNGSSWLLQTNGVTLYSISGANPTGAYSAINGALPAPTAVFSFYLDGNGMAFFGPISITNLNSISNSIVTNTVLISSNNSVANLNGKGTNTYLTNAVFSWTSGNVTLGVSSYIDPIFSFYESVLGGQANAITNSPGAWSTIAGGEFNVISGADSSASFIGAGDLNAITNSFYSFIGAGLQNFIRGPGSGHTADAILGGSLNIISNNAAGNADTILGGSVNSIFNASYSVAAGHNVTISNDNVFAWSDGTADISTTNSQARWTATNGTRLNGPLWLGAANTNAGIYFRSNSTPFSLWAVTNSMNNFDSWFGPSNGVIVHIYYSNGVPVMTLVP